jgi:ABC-type uncharacterized transport system auxiliary subunit
LLAILAGITVVAACQSLPAAPEDKYYRLLAAPIAAAQSPARLPSELAVRPLRSDGLYSERAIVFSDAQQRQLQQYHYHHWLYPPGQLVQEHLAESLRLSGIGAAIRFQEFGGATPLAVSGRIVRFDKASVAGLSKASVALELSLEKKGQVVWRKNYSSVEAVTGPTMNDFSAAMEVALNRIYGEFVSDIGGVKLD